MQYVGNTLHFDTAAAVNFGSDVIGWVYLGNDLVWYGGQPPAVTAVTPNVVSQWGERVVITGTDLDSVTEIRFKNILIPAKDITAQSATSITVMLPATPGAPDLQADLNLRSPWGAVTFLLSTVVRPKARTWEALYPAGVDPALEGTTTTETDGSVKVAWWYDQGTGYYAVYVASGGHWFKLQALNSFSGGMTGTLDGQFICAFNWPGANRDNVSNDNKAFSISASGQFLVFENDRNEMGNGDILDGGWPRGMTSADLIGWVQYDPDPNNPDPDGPDGTGVTRNVYPAATVTPRTVTYRTDAGEILDTSTMDRATLACTEPDGSVLLNDWLENGLRMVEVYVAVNKVWMSMPPVGGLGGIEVDGHGGSALCRGFNVPQSSLGINGNQGEYGVAYENGTWTLYDAQSRATVLNAANLGTYPANRIVTVDGGGTVGNTT